MNAKNIPILILNLMLFEQKTGWYMSNVSQES